MQMVRQGVPHGVSESGQAPSPPQPRRARLGLTTATEAGSPSTEQVKRRDDEPGDAEHAPGPPGRA